jgi:hypothetical protein
MHITGTSYWAVAVAAIASFLFGGLWYGIFSKQWMAATGLDDKLAKGGEKLTARPFIVMFLAQLVMALILSGVFLHLSRGGVALTMRNALLSGALIWAGFVMTTIAANNAFQGVKRSLTLIDSGHWLGVLLIQSAVLSWLAQ